MGIVRGFAEIAKEKFAPKIVRKAMFKMSERIVGKNTFSAKDVNFLSKLLYIATKRISPGQLWEMT